MKVRLSCTALVIASCMTMANAQRVLAVTLPPAVLAPLQTQVERSTKALASARGKVATHARAQQEAAAVRQRAADGSLVAHAVAQLIPGFGGLTHAFMTVQSTATVRASVAQRALDITTEQASELQGAVLDAQRRLDAVRRAASTSSSTNPTQEGASYRFGSVASESVSAESLDRYLESKASPIAGAGKVLLTAGVKYHVDPRLIVAIAGAESFFGIQLCAPYNAWGYGCPSGPVAFTSWADAASTIAQGLREHYFGDGLTTVGEIHLRWAPPNATNDPDGLNYAWADNVAHFLIEQGGDPQHLEGPLAPSR